MSTFYSSKIKNIPFPTSHVDWHESLSLLAVACCLPNNTSELYVLEKNKPADKIRLPSDKTISLLSWHPLEPVLAIGWKTSGISIVDIRKSSVKHIENVAYSVSSILWSPRGFLLFGAAANGQLSLWVLTEMSTHPQRVMLTSVDSTIASVELIRRSCTKQTVTSSEFDVFLPRGGISKNNSIDSAVFLGGCGNGKIIRIAGEVSMTVRNLETTAERLSVLAQCNAPIVKLLADQKHKILLVITEDNSLIEYKLNEENASSLTEILTLKLAAQLSDQPNFSWAGEMTLAMALGENVVRLWDIAKSDNYTLSPDLDASILKKKTVNVQSLTYCSKHRLLAAGLSNGQIAIWRRAFGQRRQKVSNVDCDRQSLFSVTGSLTAETGSAVIDPESYWQAQPVIDLLTNHGDEHLREAGANIAINTLSWDPLEGTLAASYGVQESEDQADSDESVSSEQKCFSAFILRQQPLCANLGGSGSAVVQISPQRLTVMSSNQARLLSKPSGPDLVSVRNALAATAGSGAAAATVAASGLSATSCTEAVEAVENELGVEEQLRAAFCTKEYVSVWNGRQLRVYKHGLLELISPFSTFACEFELIGMHDQIILTKEEHKLQVRNLQGTVKQLVNFTEAEGVITTAALCNGFLACLTDSGFLRTFDLTRREVKQISSPKLISSILPDFMANGETQTPRIRVSWLSINNKASLIAFSISVAQSPEASPPGVFRFPSSERADERVSWHPDPRIFVWQAESDRLQVVDFASGEYKAIVDSNDIENQELDKSRPCISQAASDFIRGRYPVRHYWDLHDSRLLVVEAAELPAEYYESVGGGTSDTGAATVATNDHTASPSTPSVGEAASDITNDLPLAKRPHSQISALSDTDCRASSRFKTEERPTLWNVTVSFFVSPEQNGMIVQEFFHLSPHHTALMGVEVPYFYFTVRADFAQALAANAQTNCSTKGPDAPSTAKVATGAGDETAAQSGGSSRQATARASTLHHLSRRVMRDFHGLEGADVITREAILNFSFFLAQGEMDAAFKSMKLIRSTAVWQNMAKMCVSTRRIDVGLVCLGKMGNALGAAMVREMRNTESSIIAQTGELALQLGMTAEAERLFVESERWDLVARMHRCLGHWEEAIQVAEKHNRVRLRNTHYTYAKELKNQGHIDDAINHFIFSKTHLVEVPRMLRDSPDKLEEFVKSHPQKELQRWWAQTLEAEGWMEEAEVYYTLAKDYLSLVRIYCCLNREEAALALCNETGDTAACYHLARQLESKQNIDNAIHLFTRARAYSSAVRLCKEHNRNEHLYSLAQLGSPEDMLEAARHLEKQPSGAGFEEKCILLYQRAGHLNTAIKLAFETRQYEALSSIATCGIDATCDPELVRKCANFFMQNSQFDRAVELLATGKQWAEAIKLCGDYDVTITEELAEKLTPPPDTTSVDRKEILTRLGYQCLAQGQYHLACKKLTQAGDRVSGMKALLRSGDTEKIIFFANVSKQRDIFVMAANYLQTLDTWRTDTDVVRLIIQFYTRGKALESLASFYEACAQVEIEECQSYEKAMSALTEAYKAISKAAATAAATADSTSISIDPALERRLLSIKTKIMFCKQFVETQMMFDEDPMEALSRCQNLLEEPQASIIIRPGDIYAIMIRELVDKERFKSAYACLQDMREKLGGRDVSRFLDRSTQVAIFQALGMPTAPTMAAITDGRPMTAASTAEGGEEDESIEDNADVGVDEDDDVDETRRSDFGADEDDGNYTEAV